LPLPIAVDEARSGLDSNARGGEDFSELKKYSDAENPNHIDWRSYARGNGLRVKKFNSGGSPLAAISWNLLQSHAREQRLSQLSKWLLQCESENRPFLLQTPGLEKKSSDPRVTIEQCWMHLASFGEEDAVA
jgi:hypothetical protein